MSVLPALVRTVTIDNDATATTTTTTTTVTASVRGAKVSARKQRCWVFDIGGIKRGVENITDDQLLSLFTKKYTTVKRLIISPGPEHASRREPNTDDGSGGGSERNMHVEVLFSGPQPSEGPGTFLCNLLLGSSFAAQPVELDRGRKKKAKASKQVAKIISPVSAIPASHVGGATAQTRSPNGMLNYVQSVGECEEALINRTDWATCATTTAELAVLGGGNDVLVPVLRRDSSFESQVTADSSVTTSSPTATFDRPAFSDVSLPLDPFATTVGRVDRTLWSNRDTVGATMPHSVGQPTTTARIALCGSNTLGCDTTKPGAQNVLDGVSREYQPGGSFDFGPAPMPQQPEQRPSRARALNPTTSARHTHNVSGGTHPVYPSTFEHLLGLEEAKGGAAPSMPINAPGRYAEYKQQDAPAWDPTWSPDVPLRTGEITVRPLQNKCNFEGRLMPTDTLTKSSCGSVFVGPRCLLQFTGIKHTGQDLGNLLVTVHFGVDSVHKVGKDASSIQVENDGHAYAAVLYPSMREIWPEMYGTTNVRLIEVDMVVEVQSNCDAFQYVGPTTKVTYVRDRNASVSGRRVY